jgi:hypothetical protein
LVHVAAEYGERARVAKVERALSVRLFVSALVLAAVVIATFLAFGGSFEAELTPAGAAERLRSVRRSPWRASGADACGRLPSDESRARRRVSEARRRD